MPITKEGDGWDYSDLKKIMSDDEFLICMVFGTVFFNAETPPDRAVFMLRAMANEIIRASIIYQELAKNNGRPH